MKRHNVLGILIGFAAVAACAASWDDVAGRFDCTQKVQAVEQASGSQFLMEFIPAGQKLGEHNRMFTVTLVRVPEDDAAANERADAAIQSVARAAKNAGAEIREFKRGSTNHGPVAFFDYVLNGEHNVGVISRTGPGILAVQQLATMKGKTPSEEDRRKVRGLIGLS
jgi:hypothetical protein